ncbi:MAG: hypothetical protein ABH986_05845 [archaeon]
MKKRIKLNSKGQGFEVFNLLIGAILALAILVIILSIINYLESIEVDSSIQSIHQKLINATQSPDGSVFVSKKVILPKDYSFNSKQFSLVLNIPEECISFDFPQAITSMSFPSSGRSAIFFNKRIQTDFFVVCQPESSEPLVFNDGSQMDCPVSCNEFCCLASFGANPSLRN